MIVALGFGARSWPGEYYFACGCLPKCDTNFKVVEDIAEVIECCISRIQCLDLLSSWHFAPGRSHSKNGI